MRLVAVTLEMLTQSRPATIQPDAPDGDPVGTKLARLETGLEIRVPLFIKEGERVKVHTETREFAGRA